MFPITMGIIIEDMDYRSVMYKYTLFIACISKPILLFPMRTDIYWGTMQDDMFIFAEYPMVAIPRYYNYKYLTLVTRELYAGVLAPPIC